MYGGQKIRLDFYTVILASTGSMKSWALNRMMSAVKAEWRPHQILDPGSTAGLLVALKESDGKAALWKIEEFGEFWTELTKEIHAGTKRLLLMNYDGESVGKGLKDEKVVVEISQIQHCWAMIGGMGDQSFVRRVEFRAFKYAVVFHWMLGKTSKFLDAEDIGWAFRLAMLHLADLRVILDATEYADFEDLLRRGEQFRQKCLREGKAFRPRELQMRLSRRLRSSDEAKSLFILVCERAARAGLEGVPCAEEIFELTGVAPDPGGPTTRVPAVDSKEPKKKNEDEK